MHAYSEGALVEQPAIQLFRALGWQTAGCFAEACALFSLGLSYGTLAVTARHAGMESKGRALWQYQPG